MLGLSGLALPGGWSTALDRWPPQWKPPWVLRVGPSLWEVRLGVG